MEDEVFKLESPGREPIRITKNSSLSSELDGYRKEIDGYRKEMCELGARDPSDVFQRIAGWAARVSDIRATVYRDESRRSTAFRTRDIDPFLDQCDFQFKVWSRIQAVREMEYKLTGGGQI